MSCDTVAPELAARVAANFLNPCADFLIPVASQASLNALPKLPLINFLLVLLQMNVSSPTGPILSVSANSGKMGRKTSVWNLLFSVLR